ncbi:DUF4062 domain-containing protein [Novosphingobium clariflavum]|uniref:DUF4062 domain-containing protein n=1 Tax=Novosphingobium clariflavum TaxID=2029884 RepID=A0ABV6S1K6_9SPHN|nr:DUF4062 domain-containing protein [Novosphingobium clariflavum]
MPAKNAPKKSPVIMISSTVYGFEELLDRIYAQLTQFGYEVWSSHSGTMPVWSHFSAFESCLRAVEQCDLFLGLITPQYGSGREGDELSITHREFLKAIELNKPRWLLAHDHVVFARGLLKNLGYATAAKRAELTLKSSALLGSLKVIDLYEAAILDKVELKDRRGNWVQTFVDPADALRYTSAQFHRFQEVERVLNEQLADPVAVLASVKERSK